MVLFCGWRLEFSGKHAGYVALIPACVFFFCQAVSGPTLGKT